MKPVFKEHFLRNINTLCLPGSRSCSMSCEYCYAGFNNFKTSPDKGISRELIDKSLDFLVDKIKPIHPPMLVIGFGGDPIEAFDYVRYAVETTKTNPKYANVKVVISTTHGQTLTEDHIKYLEENMGFISFSIDGTKEHHLKSRPNRNSSVDSYKRVLDSYEKAKHRLYCSVNATIGLHGEVSEDLIHLYDIGFRTITMLPVRPAESEIHHLDSEFNLALSKQYSRLLDKFKSMDDEKLIGILTSLTSEDYLNKFFNRIVFKNSYHRKCGAAFNFVYVGPNGDITPCASFRPYQGQQYVLGNLATGFDLEKVEPIFGFSTHKQEPCKSCEVESICSGFCFYNALATNNNVIAPVEAECDLGKYIISQLQKFYIYLKEERGNVLQAYIDHSQKIEDMDKSYFKRNVGGQALIQEG